MREQRENLNFEQALELLRDEASKFESGQTLEHEEFPGHEVLKAAITTVSLMPEAPHHLVPDLNAQINALSTEYRYAETEEEKTAVRQRIKKTIDIMLSRIDPQKREANYGAIKKEQK
jgi:hypothetical protein